MLKLNRAQEAPVLIGLIFRCSIIGHSNLSKFGLNLFNVIILQPVVYYQCVHVPPTYVRVPYEDISKQPRTLYIDLLHIVSSEVS